MVDQFLTDHFVWAWVAMGFYSLLVGAIGAKIVEREPFY